MITTAPPSGESAVPNNSANQQANYNTANEYDYVTVLTSNQPVNKCYVKNADGSIVKAVEQLTFVKLAME